MDDRRRTTDDSRLLLITICRLASDFFAALREAQTKLPTLRGVYVKIRFSQHQKPYAPDNLTSDRDSLTSEVRLLDVNIPMQYNCLCLVVRLSNRLVIKRHGDVAQLGEHHTGSVRVWGSSPHISTLIFSKSDI